MKFPATVFAAMMTAAIGFAAPANATIYDTYTWSVSFPYINGLASGSVVATGIMTLQDDVESVNNSVSWHKVTAMTGTYQTPIDAIANVVNLLPAQGFEGNDNLIGFTGTDGVAFTGPVLDYYGISFTVAPPIYVSQVTMINLSSNTPGVVTDNSTFTGDGTLTMSLVPEPASAGLLAVGLITAAIRRRRAV
jgi:hypothetical protein